jgi:SAM-dependent methyltransferase
MVNVHVNVHNEQYTVPDYDEKAVELFRRQWQLYRKFLQYDYLGNAGAYVELHRFLTQEFARPFRFVDLACGDASGVVPALQGTPISHYRGIDLAQPALDLAATNLKALPCEVALENVDFVAAMRDRRDSADVAWISLSLHHLPTAEKAVLMREVHRALAHEGAFLIYEPTRADDEERPEYLDRFEAIGRRDWTGLSDVEFKEAMNHVRTCDLPETDLQWQTLGRDAGFSRTAQLYVSPDGLFRMYSFRS